MNMRAEDHTTRDMDAALGGEERIVPSSGFLDRVMDAVRREAREPEPLPFPWLRALPGLTAALFAIAAVVYFALHGSAAPSAQARALPPDVSPAINSHAANQMLTLIGSAASVHNGWMVLALVLTIGCIHLSLRLGADK